MSSTRSSAARLLPLLLFLWILSGCAASEQVAAPADPPPPADTAPETTAAPEPDEPEAAEPLFDGAPDDWYLRDPEEAAFPGVSADRAYATLLQGKAPKKTVVVAVIDSGIDIEHDDLDDNLWTNEDEVPGNGLDDDGNGYVDDVHGWNFIGGPGGEQIEFDTFEVTRELARLEPVYGEADPATLSGEARAEYDYYLEVKQAYEAVRAEYQQNLANINGAVQAVGQAHAMLAQHFGTEDYTMDQVAALDTADQMLGRAREIMLYLAQVGVDREALARQQKSIENRLNYGLNLDFDPRPLVGDDYGDASERVYGNNEVAGPDPFHGTHVAGIIAAERGNGLGLDGIAPSARIMVLRAVPDGDERDKDVANAIRYAVDNGADIINMSFGKDFSPQKEAVDAAVRHAEANGVLLVHGAGNDGEDIDVGRNYPTRYYADEAEAATWIEVGASSWEGAEMLAAPFSNYGKQNVDLFAPGVSIYSTVPDQGFDRADGTSMAAPVVSGVAALVMAYYPELTAVQVRDVLMRSAVPYAGQMVVRPGTEGEPVDFAALSRTGGLVNAYAALQLAAEVAGQ